MGCKYCNALAPGCFWKQFRNCNRMQSLMPIAHDSFMWTPPPKKIVRELHWLLIVFWAQFKKLCITYKAPYGLGPGYLKDHFTFQVPALPLQSSRESLLCIPPLSEHDWWERRRRLSPLPHPLPEEAEAHSRKRPTRSLHFRTFIGAYKWCCSDLPFYDCNFWFPCFMTFKCIFVVFFMFFWCELP